MTQVGEGWAALKKMLGWNLNRSVLILLAGIASTITTGCGSAGVASSPPPPVLSISTNALSFVATQGSASNPIPGSVSVSNSGGGTLNFTASSDSPWLTVAPTSGAAPQTLQISAATGSLTASVNTGHITISSPGATGSPAIITVTFLVAPVPANTPFWAQWGANPQHSGSVAVAGQNSAHKLADIIYDPFIPQEKAENLGAFGSADLLVHYQAQIVDGNDVYMMVKSGTYKSCAPAGAWASQNAKCGPNTWNTMIWNEARFTWLNNQLIQVWTFPSDWKPEPNGSALFGWEPVFHPADANNFIYVPGAGGTIWKVDKAAGTPVSHINPFASTNISAPNTFVAGPLSADSQGNIYYNVIELADPAAGDPWSASDAQGAWLVKVKPDDSSIIATYASLVPGAPVANSNTCPTVTGGSSRCGSQRPGVNVAPAIAPDGTIYTASVAHFNAAQAYVVAVNSNLTPKWAATMQNVLTDACPVGSPPTCVKGSGQIIDQASSSPTVLPDGAVLFGAFTGYNGERGHMLKFDSLGNFLGAYDFGWDSTPAVYVHGATYSIIIKDNFYATSGPYYITQLNPSLQIEWQFQNTNPAQANGFEWCINMPAVDMNGTVYANSEDGSIYVIPQGHTGIFTQPQGSLFLNLALGAAYTPLSIGPDGKLYTQNNGHMFAVGN